MFSTRLYPLLTLMSWVVSTALFAQISEPRPLPSARYQLPALDKAWVAPPINLTSIEAEDAVNDLQNEPIRFAWPFAVTLDLKDGEWTELTNGDRIWRLRIEAPDAQAITLLYDRFYLPPGATLHLRNPITNEILGAFTEANNNQVRRFATGAVRGDITELEYFEPAAQRGQGTIRVAQVGHAYRLMGALEDFEDLDDAGPCQVNINCTEGNDWQNEKRGVARYFINGTATCSGTLVNNTAEDGTPYFLTADHCIGGMDALGDIDGSGFLFYWNFERSGCENTGNVPINTTSGATLVANNSDSDFALFRLTETPNGNFNPYFNGWSAETTTGTGGVGIHHPRLDAKKIATHNVEPDGEQEPNFWRLFWSPTDNGHSVTEGGSSGSGLWNSDHRLIGQLLGGSSLNCSDPANDVGVYGKIAVSWESNGAEEPGRRLRDWLDPLNTGTLILDGADITPGPPTVGFLNLPADVQISIREGEDALDELPGDCRSYSDQEFLVSATFLPTGPFTATVTASGSAVAGRDYELLNNQVMFSPDVQEGTVTVRIFDDASVGVEKNLELNLSGNGSGATIGLFDRIALTITDDDAPIGATTLEDVFAENFEGDLEQWTVDNGGSTSQTWSIVELFEGNTLNGTSFLFYDSDGPGNGQTSNETITSEVINTAGINELSLSFEQYFRTYNQGDFEETRVEVFDGAAWQEIYYRSEDDGSIGGWGNANVVTIDVSQYTNANFQVRFNFVAGYDWWWAVDNIRLQGQLPTSIADEVSADAAEVYLGPMSTVPVRDPATNKVIAELTNPTAFDYGCTFITLDRLRDDQDVYPLYSNDPGEVAMARSLFIRTGNSNPTPFYQLRIFLEPEDISSWEAATQESLSSAGIYVLPENTIPSTTPDNFPASTAQWSAGTTGNLGSLNYIEANLTAFGGIAVGLDAFASLPVTWASFTGSAINDKLNRLNWSTQTETNNDRFWVEYANGTNSFEAIGEVSAIGDYSSYTFDHNNPKVGLNLYRIRQIDFDGAFSFSPVISITNATGALGRILVSPTTRTQLSLNIREDVQQIEVIDASGRLVTQKMTNRSLGSTFTLPLPAGITAGLYFVRFSSNEEVLTQRVIIR